MGSTTITFGGFPGSAMATVVVTGLVGITSASKCEAFFDATQPATTDHSPDEHLAVDADLRCEAIVPGTGFTIVAVARGNGALFEYGAYNVTWVYN
jgi:hypothetical protein